RGEPEHLPEGKIPGHDGEDRANRLIADVSDRALGRNRFVSQKRFGILRVIPTTPGALDCFVDGSLERLAHFGRHDAAEGILSPFKNVGRGQHHARAVSKTCAAITRKNTGRASDLLFDLRISERRECSKHLAGGWIDRCDADEDNPLPGTPLLTT